MNVLTWNLMHGRAVPPARRELFEEFAAALGSWDWDIALLQEVPPWWSEPLARSLHAEQRHVLTSRNALLPLRAALAMRWPDLIKSNGGGANAILVRVAAAGQQRVKRLRWLPERRWLHAVPLPAGEAGAVWVGNLHTQASVADAQLAARTLLEWAGDDGAVLGGDFNVRDLCLPGFARLGGNGVDQVFATSGFDVAETRVLERGRLSDHAPVLVRTAAPGRTRSRV